MSHHEQEHKHRILPLWIYLAVGGTLLVLTGLTITAASIDFNTMSGFPSMNFAIAMVIATIKATLVALIFMHLLYDKKFYLYCVLAAVGCLMIFITLTLSDTQYRGRVSSIESRPIVPQVPREKFVAQPAHHEAAPAHHEAAPENHEAEPAHQEATPEHKSHH